MTARLRSATLGDAGFQVGIAQIGAGEPGLAHQSIFQVRAAKEGLLQVGLGQIHTFQIHANPADSREVSPMKIRTHDDDRDAS